MTRLTVERLTRRAEGAGRGPDGDRVLVPLTLPGELVEGEIADGRMSDPRIVEPSPHRVPPPCPHFAHCGGCALQHADDGYVAGWKTELTRAALAARGIEARIAGISTSPRRSRRRAVLSGRRTRKAALVGFHARASHEIVDIAECIVLRPGIVAALPALRALVAAGASRSGELSLTVIEGPAGLDLAVAGGRVPDAALLGQLIAISAAAGISRLSWNGEVIALHRPPVLPMGGAMLVPPPGGFLQATAEGQAALTAVVMKACAGAARIIDLFAGSGTFALPLSRQASVHAVEGLAAPLAALDSAWRRAGGRPALTTECRDLAANPVTTPELAGFDAIVIDPPRSGAESQAAQIAAAEVPVIAWISCDPVSFARDAATVIAGGYRLDRLFVVDQFRWSAQVETVALFRRS